MATATEASNAGRGNLLKLLIAGIIGGIIWACPLPAGVTQEGWLILSIFVPTIFCIITKPLPMGAVAFFALTLCVLSKAIPIEHALEGFGYEVVWLVILAFFIAKGFLVTAFGDRVAYFFVSILGGSSLGLSYGLALTDLLLAPVIPSVSARMAGTIYPIVQSIARSFGSLPHHPSRLKIGAFLTMTTYQTGAVTCAMFMTAMAANPLVAEFTRARGITFGWRDWAIAASLPGLVSLLVLPLVIIRLAPPELTVTPAAPHYAREKLLAMGKMSRKETIMALTMMLLLGLWMFGDAIQISTVTAAMVGLCILVLTGVLPWGTLIREADAWETFIWFSILLVMAKYLGVYGIPQWFSQVVVAKINHIDWRFALAIIVFVYFYSHYFFASATAHVSAMYVPFLVALLGLGAPTMLVVFLLAFSSNLFGGLTHYTLSPGPLLYGVGYCDIASFAKVGFVGSLVNVVIWGSLGVGWWKVLGYW